MVNHMGNSTAAEAAAAAVVETITYKVSWDFKFIIVSLAVSFLGALVAVQLSEQRRRAVLQGKGYVAEVYLGLMSAAIGIVAIWAMHFTGMMAMQVKLPGSDEKVDVTYDLGWTVFSMFAALVFVYVGLRIAMKDKFFSSLNTQATLAAGMQGKSLASMKQASTVKMAAFVSDLHWLVLGGVFTAGGVGAMHFTGMVSQSFSQKTEWNYGIVVTAMIIAIVAASAAFWIIFRFLAWKPNNDAFRIIAAIVMSVAVNGMHYTGMMAATYTPAADGPKDAQITPVTALVLALVALLLIVIPSYQFMISDLRHTLDQTLTKIVPELTEVTVSVGGGGKKSGAMNLAVMI